MFTIQFRQTYRKSRGIQISLFENVQIFESRYKISSIFTKNVQIFNKSYVNILKMLIFSWLSSKIINLCLIFYLQNFKISKMYFDTP